MIAARGTLRSGLVLPVVFAFVTVASFTALGTWQLERRAWKEALIAKLDRRLADQATPLPPRAVWANLNSAEDEFRRVSFSAAFIPGMQALVYTASSPVRTQPSGPGYWLFALARLASGDLLAINRGFLPENHQDSETLVEPGASRTMVGVMRWPEARGYFAPRGDSAHNLWFVRDHLAIAAGMGWQQSGAQLPPFYIDLEAPAPASGWPRPVTPGINVRNAHLQYAITWYALAGVVSFMFVIWLRNRRQGA
jgi:cytochrome oxidase assembly protein ShyY1